MTKKSQYFKHVYPKEEFVSFVETIGEPDRSWYVIDYSSFRKAIANNSLSCFLSMLSECYFENKKHFVFKAYTSYKSFLTCIRQQCNFHKINYQNNVNYHKSEYQIIYFIYILPDLSSSSILSTTKIESMIKEEKEK